MKQANYVVQSRQNSTLQLAGIIDDYATLDMILRFNDVSEWTMTIDRRSAHLPNLIPVSHPMGLNGNGIIVTRDYGNGPQVILSGPITHIDYSKKSQLATLKGYDDKIWLKWRNADTVPASYPFATEALTVVPLRYYKLGESSGTTAADASGHANGVYNASGVTYGQPALIDTLDTCVKLDGAAGFVTVPTTSLAAGNAAWSVFGWGMLPSIPSGVATMWSFGTNATREAVHIGVGASSGLPYMNTIGVASVTGPTPVQAHVPFFLAVTWDGTTMRGYLNGALFGTMTPGTLSITYGVASLGKFLNGTTEWWPGYLGHCGFVNGTLSAAQVQLLYQVGLSRLADAASDNRSGQASTVMLAYVNANAGPGTLAKRQVANLALASDPALGGQVTGVAREDTLLTILQNLALQSGDNIGFKVEQTLNPGANQMIFSCYGPNDRTSTALFSDEIGNLADYSYSLDWPTMNAAIVGDGSNTGTARTFLEVDDAASISAYGRIEGFVQGVASTDYTTMLNAGNAALLQTRAATTLSITPVDTAGLMYQRDYNLGDKVTVVIEGQTIQDKVREVRITLAKGIGADSPDELVTPAIGQPDVTQAVTGMLSWLSNSVNKRLAKAASRLNTLERNR